MHKAHGASRYGMLRVLYAERLTEDGEADKQSRQQGSNQGYNGDLGIDGRTGSILEGVAYGVADNGSLMSFAALTAFMTGFHVLLGVVPEAAGVGHEEGDQKTGNDVA